MAKKETMTIEFIGKNADEVTGSMTLIKSNGLNILLEAGIYQSNDTLEDYKINSRNLNINLKKIDFIIIGHVHADHTMLIPRLVANGCNAKIIVPKGSKGFLELLGKDSAFIVERDCQMLERKYKRTFHRIYTPSDVDKMLSYIEEYPMGEKIELNDRLTIRYIPAGHILNSAQIELWVKNEKKNKTVKILYTSDLGNIKLPKYYAQSFESVDKANIVIGESTYSDKDRYVKAETRKKDLEKMYEVIKYHEGIVEIPIFAMDRCPNIVTILYDLFGYDKDFKQDIVVDSPLAVKILKHYLEVLEGDDYLKLKEVMDWKNLILIEDAVDSKEYMSRAKNCVVLTAAGMLGAGRSRIWLKHIISGRKNTLLFVGYASHNTLASKIKDNKGKGVIKIDSKTYPNRCKIMDLKSFTSHMQYDDLLHYYSTVQADKICLVHGDFNSKCEFAKELQKEIDKKFGRARVVIVNKGTSIKL